MRSLKTLLITLATLLAIAGGLVLFAPSEVVVSQIAGIAASDSVLLQLANDPSAPIWQGFEVAGPTAATEDGTGIGRAAGVQKPFPLEGVLELRIIPHGDSSQAALTWTAGLDLAGRVQYMLHEVKPRVSDQLQQGLYALRNRAEAVQDSIRTERHARTFHGYYVEEGDVPAMELLGRRSIVPIAGLTGHLRQLYGTLDSVAAAAHLSLQGPPMAVYYRWDTVAGTTDVFAGRAMQPDTLPKGLPFTALQLSGGAVFRVQHRGGHARSAVAYRALEARAEAAGRKPRAAPYERYLQWAGNEADSSRWHMEVVLPVGGAAAE